MGRIAKLCGVPALAVLAACQLLPIGLDGAHTDASTVAVHGQVAAGPVCPVVTEPPDPACADRPVAGATLLILDVDGAEVARVTSDADGSFEVRLPPGRYRVVPQPVDGLMGTAGEQELRVAAGAPASPLEISYDTGIR